MIPYMGKESLHMHLRILIWGDYPELFEWALKAITCNFIGRRGFHRRESDVITGAEIGMMWPSQVMLSAIGSWKRQ